MSEDDIGERKSDHIDVTTEEDVESQGKTTLLEEVEFFHDSLPELALDDIDVSTRAFGCRLDAPLVISGMTGGTERAKRLNRKLARTASELGLAMGVGSQRAMLEEPSLADSYEVREVAPDMPLLGNLGAVQAAEASVEEIRGLVDAIDADALCLHLNPGQELVQPEGDDDFSRCLDAVARVADGLDVPVVAKETGCGLSPVALDKLADTPVEWVDTSGAGGTTWIGVETLRKPDSERDVGELFWDWGTPTAASIVYARRRDFEVIGSGGLRSGLDAARAIGLGARLAGMALPWIRAVHEHDGIEKALEFGRTTIRALETACALTGSTSVEQLRQAPCHLGNELRSWLDDDPAASVD